MPEPHLLEKLILIAGIGQTILAIGSMIIPKLLDWRSELSKLRPLIRQIFWTYAGYILMTNLSFGLLSLASPSSLIDRSFLATCVTLFIALHWACRLAIQFFYFDRSDAPKGIFYTAAEFLLVGGFIFFTAVYVLAFVYNLNW